MREKKEKKKVGLILFIVILMIGTSFSVVFFGGTGSNSVRENGIKFTSNGQIWTAKINAMPAAFSYLPSETKGINITGTMPDFQGKIEIDTTSSPSDTNNRTIALAQHQMGLVLSTCNIFIRQGFTFNNTYGVPIIKCSDNTESVPVILFRSANITQIKIENCIIVEASSEADFIRAKDKIVYMILGVLHG